MNERYLFDLTVSSREIGTSTAYSLMADSLQEVPSEAKNVRRIKEGSVIRIELNQQNWPVKIIYSSSGTPNRNEFYGYRWPTTIEIPYGKIEGLIYKAKHSIIRD